MPEYSAPSLNSQARELERQILREEVLARGRQLRLQLTAVEEHARPHAEKLCGQYTRGYLTLRDLIVELVELHVKAGEAVY